MTNVPKAIEALKVAVRAAVMDALGDFEAATGITPEAIGIELDVEAHGADATRSSYVRAVTVKLGEF